MAAMGRWPLRAGALSAALLFATACGSSGGEGGGSDTGTSGGGDSTAQVDTGTGDTQVAENCTCEGKECGTDGCGNACGECSGGSICLAGTCSKQCVPEGTGRAEGDQIANITWTDTEGNSVSLHDACGIAPAVLLMRTATW